MTSRPWRAGIVGCGKIAGGWDHPNEHGPATTHAQAYHMAPGFELVTAVDPDEAGLQRFGQAWGVPHCYASVEEMAKAGPLDVVSICSPDELHFSQACQLLIQDAKPRVLLIEKPVCLNSSDLEQLSGLADDSGVAVLVNHTRRFDPAHQHIAQLIKSGNLGPFLHGRCTYYGGWVHNGCHLVDTIAMLFDERPRIQSAEFSGAEDLSGANLDVRLEIKGGTIEIDAFNGGYYQLFQSEFRFERGRVQLLDFGNDVVVEQVSVNELGERVLTPHEESPVQGLVSPLNSAVEAVGAHLRGCEILDRLDVGLPAAMSTMSVIWQAGEMALASTTGPSPEKAG